MGQSGRIPSGATQWQDIPGQLGRTVILLKSVVFTTGWSLCVPPPPFSPHAFPSSSSPNSPANDPEPQSLLLVSKGVGRQKLTRLNSAASYVAFNNSNALNSIHPVDCSPECLQAYSNITGKRSMSFSSPEFPIDMSGRRCSGRITSKFVKT